MTTDQQAAIAAYRARPAINASVLKKCMTSMLHGKTEWDRKGDGKPTPAMELGSAVHALITQSQPVLAFEGTRRGKEWESFAEINSGALILPESAFAAAMSMSAAGGFELACSGVEIAKMRREEPLYWRRGGYDCKALPDAFTPGILLEIKTAKDISARAIAKQLASGWAVQLGWYVDALASIDPTPPRVLLLTIENGGTPDAILYEVDPLAIEWGQLKARALADEFAAALKSGAFHGRPKPKRGETINLPDWVEHDISEMFSDDE
jgi:hypothetical protein